jgi:glycolate oxidase
MEAETLIDDLRRMLPVGTVNATPAVLRTYARDATALWSGRPDAVVTPTSPIEVESVVRIARRHRAPVVARGAGSSLSAAAVPVHGGIVLSFTGMDAILDIDPVEQVAVVQPGVTTQALDAAAARHGLMYPPDPGSRHVSTLGGNIACGAGGLRGGKYGTTRNYVLGLRAVDGTGTTIVTGSRVEKDVAGYDLTRLLVGSEGTLALITEAVLRLVPRPEATQYGVASFSTVEAAASAAAAVRSTGRPATLELLDHVCVRVIEAHTPAGLDTEAAAVLIFGDDGTEAEAHDRTQAIARTLRSCTDVRSVSIAATDEQAQEILAARRCSLPALARLGPTTLLEDITVPVSRLAEAVKAIQSVAQTHQVTIGVFGHAGDGNLHPTIVFDERDPQQTDRARSAMAAIFAIPARWGGSLTGEHGVGAAKLSYLRATTDDATWALMNRVKAAFDPDNILNPGKLGSA